MKIELLYDKLAGPARRALETLCLATVKDLAKYPRSAIAELHGIGPSALKTVAAELAAQGLAFKVEGKTSSRMGRGAYANIVVPRP